MKFWFVLLGLAYGVPATVVAALTVQLPVALPRLVIWVATRSVQATPYHD